ncbi:MAG: hypothetical protein KGR98_14050, partial [Verrucomicrobia bacterium]|nr:hypothetical protein [Verrucomicrobiota bacterium]
MASGVPAKNAIFYAGPRSDGVWFGRSANPAAPGGRSMAGDLSSVVEAVRAARKARGPRSRAILILRGGTYPLAAPLVLTPEDSGLTIAAYQDETPVLSGGRRITGWRKAPGKPGWWETEIPSVRDGDWYFRSLFVNGRRARRARAPNAGSFYTMRGERVSDHPVQFHFQPGDINPAWAGDPDVEVVGLETWITYRLHIQSVSTQSNLVTLGGNAIKAAREKGGGRYFIENTPDALDAPGEWYLNRKTGVLTYVAQPGEDLNRAEVIAPRLMELVRLEGDHAARRPVRHVTLRGLTFSCTDWSIPADGFVDLQAAFRIRGAVRA